MKIRILILLLCAMLACSCRSLSHTKPYHCPEIRLSTLAETTVQFDRSRHAGINLIILNDLKSDVFLRSSPRDEFEIKPVNTKEAFRLPDTDEIYRKYEGSGMYPFKFADSFLYVWAGNKTSYHIDRRSIPSSKSYFPLTYYHCKDGGFYTRSITIVEANK